MRARATAHPLCLLILIFMSCVSICRADDSFFRRAADCATVNELRVIELIPMTKIDDETALAPLQRLVELGLAFAGTAYMQGLRDPLASDLLNQSMDRISAMDTKSRDAFRDACNKEAQILWDDANAVQRWLATGKAKLGLRRLLQDQKSAMMASRNGN